MINIQRTLITTAKILSACFNPFYLPIVGLILLFTLSYMSMMTWAYKLNVLILVYIFTIFLPTLLIYYYRRYQGWNLMELGLKERRIVPYIISIVCYFACYYIMILMRIPRFMGNILVAALLIQMICALINIWWKISTHSAAIGGVTGALIAFSIIFGFNPVWWLSLSLIVAGLVGTSRMVLRQHSLSQVVVGYLLGIVIAFYTLLFYAF